MAARPQSRAGDVTGREREKQQADHAKEIRAGAERMTMVNPPPPSEISMDVEDLTGEGGVRMLTLDDIAAEGLTDIPISAAPQEIDPTMLDDGRVTPGLPEQKPVRPEEPQPMRPGAEEVTAGSVLPGARQTLVKEATFETIVAEKPFKILRVNEDLDEVTIGKGNTFTFLQNKYYRVTPEVYDHLNEKGFVYH